MITPAQGGVPSAPRRLTVATLGAGARELAAADPDLREILARLGVPPMWGRRPGFATLVHIILEQQVSIAAAHTMYRRLADRLGGMHPEGVRAMGVQGLRDFGLTRQKAAYCHALALRVLTGRLDLTAVARASDDAARRMLLEVPGVGPWSADIYALMALRRPDIWPRGDLALASALRDIRSLRRLPTMTDQLALTAPWSPWRSVAARLLWNHYLAARGRNPAARR